MSTRKRSHRFPFPDEYQDTTHYDPKNGILDLGYQRLRSIKSFPFNTIVKLFVDYNDLTYLPDLPNLEYLSCKGNRLRAIPNCPKLVWLSAAENKITSITSKSLTSIDLSHNPFQLSYLPKCSSLFLERTNITTIDLSLVPAIRILDLSNNKLTLLQDHIKLEELHIKNNRLTKLGMYPNLLHLDASGNRISSMQTYPKIDTMNVCHNKLTEIAQASLTSLIASFNQLKQIDTPNLTYLDVSNNQINKIIIPRKTISAFIYDNPLTHISGHLTYLKEITVDHNGYKLLNVKPLRVMSVVIESKLPDIALGLVDCNGDMEIIKSVAKSAGVSVSTMKKWYYSALRITIQL